MDDALAYDCAVGLAVGRSVVGVGVSVGLGVWLTDVGAADG